MAGPHHDDYPRAARRHLVDATLLKMRQRRTHDISRLCDTPMLEPLDLPNLWLVFCGVLGFSHGTLRRVTRLPRSGPIKHEDGFSMLKSSIRP